MVNFSVRSDKKELLDADDIPFADIRQNMKELNRINSLLGGHKITLHGIQHLVKSKKVLIICEIGCGGGDNLNVISEWSKQRNIEASFVGIDIKKECILFAKEQYPLINAEWIIDDYSNVVFSDKPHIIFSSLFCHHFNEGQLIEMLKWMQENSATGFFINDLQRHPIAYYSIRILTRIFSHSYLVKNDAPLSVARGFKKSEWISLLHKAGIKKYKIQWKWAFRYLIIVTK